VFAPFLIIILIILLSFFCQNAKKFKKTQKLSEQVDRRTKIDET
jgi:preprotein translocase subunit YajC